jgi:hypothetical protein
MGVEAKNDLVSGFLLLSLSSAAAAVALGETQACVGSLGAAALCWALFPGPAVLACRATGQACIAFASWAMKACFIGTVVVASTLSLAAWLLDMPQLFGVGLQALALGVVSTLLVGLPLCFRSGDGFNKAPQGLPSVWEAQQEADELLLHEWKKQGTP